jgi:hypothetical protein
MRAKKFEKRKGYEKRNEGEKGRKTKWCRKRNGRKATVVLSEAEASTLWKIPVAGIIKGLCGFQLPA